MSEVDLHGRSCEHREVTEYAVVVHEDSHGGFLGEVPDLPGCYSQGDSVDELMNNISEAIAAVLEVMERSPNE